MTDAGQSQYGIVGTKQQKKTLDTPKMDLCRIYYDSYIDEKLHDPYFFFCCPTSTKVAHVEKYIGMLL